MANTTYQNLKVYFILIIYMGQGCVLVSAVPTEARRSVRSSGATGSCEVLDIGTGNLIEFCAIAANALRL